MLSANKRSLSRSSLFFKESAHMKKIKTSTMRSLFALAFVVACACGAARADVRDGRIISARAGGVNFVSGDVRVRRAGAEDWAGLTAEDELRSGDTVRTGATGRVEVLLNPGSYFRAGGSTEFTLKDADLDDLRIELRRGSAVVEATGYGYGDTDLSIALATPHGLVRIVRSGVYRVNVPAAGPTELAVSKGRAYLDRTLVKGGKVARASAGGDVEVAKLDKESRDELDFWSRDRGKELAKANERLTRRVMTAAFARSSYDNLFSASGNNAGLWFFNPSARCYTFIPFFGYWRSPYGYGYDTGVRPYPSPGQSWRPGYYPPGGGGGAASNPTGGGRWNPGGGGGAGSGGNGGLAPMRPTVETPRARPESIPRADRPVDKGSRP
jgi:hypothetical protein